MRPLTLALPALAAALLLAQPATLQAQADLVALDRVHQLYRDGQSRNAARALAEVSAAFRQEIGRCKDPEIGAQLMDLEPRIDALVSRLATGTVANESVLTNEFTVYDQLLAANHVQLAELGWGQRRSGRLDAVGRELDLAVRYAERSVSWGRRPVDATTRETLTAARATAAALMAAPTQPPADAERTLLALAALVRRPQ